MPGIDEALAEIKLIKTDVDAIPGQIEALQTTLQVGTLEEVPRGGGPAPYHRDYSQQTSGTGTGGQGATDKIR